MATYLTQYYAYLSVIQVYADYTAFNVSGSPFSSMVQASDNSADSTLTVGETITTAGGITIPSRW